MARYSEERQAFWENYEAVKKKQNEISLIPVRNFDIFGGSQAGIKTGTKNITLEMIFRISDILNVEPYVLFENIKIGGKRNV